MTLKEALKKVNEATGRSCKIEIAQWYWHHNKECDQIVFDLFVSGAEASIKGFSLEEVIEKAVAYYSVEVTPTETIDEKDL